MFWLILLLYIIICSILYVSLDASYKAGSLQVFKMPKSKFIYYLLSFTWGLPMNAIGLLVVSVIVLVTKNKPVKYGWNYCIELDVNFGLELGIFFIAPKNGPKRTKNHEHGHSIQNIYLGIFSIGVVSIPSATRYWIREWQRYKGEKLPDYDSIWFEGSATKSGDEFMSKFE